MRASLYFKAPPFSADSYALKDEIQHGLQDPLLVQLRCFDLKVCVEIRKQLAVTYCHHQGMDDEIGRLKIHVLP
jgi:hypothetical protein